MYRNTLTNNETQVLMKHYEVTDIKDTRSGFGDALLELGRNNEDIVALNADLTGSVKMHLFAREFPERFFQAGIAEANMMSIAAGLTIGGKMPFVGSFANFVTGRVFDRSGNLLHIQIKM